MSTAGTSINMLNSEQKWRIGKWLETNSKNPALKNIGYENVRMMLTKAMGFDISMSSVVTMVKATGTNGFYRAHSGRNPNSEKARMNAMRELIIWNAEATMQIAKHAGMNVSARGIELLMSARDACKQ